MEEPRLPSIFLLASPETSPSTLFTLYDVLASAGIAYDEMLSGEAGAPVLDVKIVAEQSEPFRCAGGLLVEPAAALNELPIPDAAIVCDMYVPVNQSPLGRYPQAAQWLRSLYDAGAIVSSVCSGSLVLADAGLLDGRKATSHWAYEQMFRSYYPKVKLSTQDTLIVCGDDERIVTAGGVASWQDLALYTIARLCGAEHAMGVAKVHILSGHDEGQLPYAVMGRRIQDEDAVIRQSQMWIADHYRLANPVSRMVERSGLNQRTFARRFLAATGYSPIEYVHSLRVEEAKQLLETADLSIEDIGAEVGYEDAASFRRLFKRKAGLTPAAYRRKFLRIVSSAVS